MGNGALGGRVEAESFDIAMKHLPPAFEGYRIVHISDVHLSEKYNDWQSVVELAAAQKPDLLVLTGDILHNHEELEKSGLRGLCEGLAAVCEVYAVTGNHELRGRGIPFWRDFYEKSGVHPMDNCCELIERGGEALAVMGLGGNTPYFTGLYKEIEKIKDIPKLLLAHRPEYWKGCLSERWAVRPDLTFSGHAHGGQVRLPLLGGLYAPGQGIFPRRTSGLYTAGERGLVVSRGLTDRLFPKRICNAPHLPVVTLRRADGC